jgi:ATP synthase protein I
MRVKMTKREKLPSLDALGEDIRKLHDKVAPKPNPAPKAGAALAMRVGVELASGALVGGASGYFLDKWLNTSPFLFICCFFLGSAGGFLTLVRMMKTADGNGDAQMQKGSNGS